MFDKISVKDKVISRLEQEIQRLKLEMTAKKNSMQQEINEKVADNLEQRALIDKLKNENQRLRDELE
jgi:hypothetical protein